MRIQGLVSTVRSRITRNQGTCTKVPRILQDAACLAFVPVRVFGLKGLQGLGPARFFSSEVFGLEEGVGKSLKEKGCSGSLLWKLLPSE